jgi:hypothetical protein
VSSQRRIVLSVAALAALVGGFWFLVLAPKRTEISSTTDKITQAQTRLDTAQAAVANADQARAGYQRDYATLARIGKAVPADDDVASLIFQLETIARANKIDFHAVKLSGAGAAPATDAATVNPTKGADDAGKKSDAAATAAATPVPPVVTQPPPGSVVGTAGLLTVPFTFTFNGDYLELQKLLKAINGLANSKKERISVRGRLLTVDGFALTASTKGFPELKAQVSATAYLAPTADPTAVATPQTPAGATAPSSGTTAMITPNGAAR